MIRTRSIPATTALGLVVLTLACAWVVFGALYYVQPPSDPGTGTLSILDYGSPLELATGENSVPPPSGELEPQALDQSSQPPFDQGGQPLPAQGDPPFLDEGDQLPDSTGFDLSAANVRFTFIEDAALVLAFTGLGALLLSRDPKNRAGLICLSVIVVPISDLLTLYAAHHLPGAEWAAWVGSWAHIPIMGLIAILIMLLLDGHLPHRGWRPVVWVLAALTGGVTLLSGLVPFPFPLMAPSPLGIPSIEPVLVIVDGVYRFWFVVQVVVLACVVHRLGLARGAERAQAAWVLAGASVYLFGGDVVAWIRGAVPALTELGVTLPVQRGIDLFAILALPVACGVAILRYRIVSINPWFQRLLTFVLLGVLLTGLYLALNVRVYWALPGSPAPGLPAPAFSASGNGEVLLVEVVTEPVRMTVTAVGLGLLSPLLYSWLRGGLNRLIYGRRGSPADIVAALGRLLAAASGPDDVLAALADTVERALPNSRVRVILTSAGRELRRVTRGQADDDFESVPLVFQGVDLGRVEVSVGARRLDPADRALVVELAVGASAAVAAARRSSELQVAREQLVTAREQERGRIARDLHDGVGPVLSGLGFTLDALRASRGSAEAEQVTAQARQQVREAVQLVRRVANQLRPASVDQLGLSGAIREMAAWHNSTALSVHLDCDDDLGDLTAATAVAAYAIVAEALTNVARHANATSCHITMKRNDDTLVVTVEDDGIGLRGAAAGLGRTSMSERADELGGHCVVTNRQCGGTRVEVILPTAEPSPSVPVSVGPANAQ